VESTHRRTLCSCNPRSQRRGTVLDMDAAHLPTCSCEPDALYGLHSRLRHAGDSGASRRHGERHPIVTCGACGRARASPPTVHHCFTSASPAVCHAASTSNIAEAIRGYF
jgi:hypothetical protein